MSWLIGAAVLFLLAMLPLGGRVCFDGEGLRVWVLAGPVRLTLYPRPKRKKKEKKQPEKRAEGKPLPEPPQPKQEAPEEKTGGRLTDFLPFLRLLLDLLGDLRRKLRVDNLYLRLILACDDPADLAVNYARAWTALGNLLPNLERFLSIRKRDIRLDCDFASDQTRLVVRGDVTIRLGQLLALVAVYGVRALKEYLNLKSIRKGGANNESKAS